jgi:hypothetical protein
LSKPSHLRIPDFEAWPRALPVGPSFQLFLALDGRQFGNQEIRDFARRALEQGMVTASVWGPDCERVHDLIDDAIIDTRAGETTGSVILTIWHADDTLEAALDFFAQVLEPAADYAGSSRLAASIGNDTYGKAIRSHLKLGGL